eukprot:5489125-Pyramimonas_sp.AAC.1
MIFLLPSSSCSSSLSPPSQPDPPARLILAPLVWVHPCAKKVCTLLGVPSGHSSTDQVGR